MSLKVMVHIYIYIYAITIHHLVNNQCNYNFFFLNQSLTFEAPINVA